MTPAGKLVVVVKGYPRLSETFVAQELRGLELAEFDIVIVSLRRPTDKRRHAVHDEMRAPVHYLPEYLYQEPLRVALALWRAARLPGFRPSLRAFLGDVRRDLTPNRVRRFGQACVLVAEWPAGGAMLHAHFIHTPASVADYAARIMGMGWTVSAHAKDIWTSPAWELAGKLARARWAVTCTATGHAHLQSLAADPARVHLSYHGLNLDRFPQFMAKRPDRHGGNADDPVRILSVGRAVPKKGYDILLRALAQLPAQLHWRFTHIGGGPERAALQALAETLGIAPRITWRGALAQNQVLQAYRDADIFALACRITADGDRDGLPNVLLEAASQALVCVTTNISGIPEIFSSGENSWLSVPDDVTAFSRALQTAITSPGARKRMGYAAEQKVHTTLDFRTSVSQLAALFTKGELHE